MSLLLRSLALISTTEMVTKGRWMVPGYKVCVFWEIGGRTGWMADTRCRRNSVISLCCKRGNGDEASRREGCGRRVGGKLDVLTPGTGHAEAGIAVVNQAEVGGRNILFLLNVVNRCLGVRGEWGCHPVARRMDHSLGIQTFGEILFMPALRGSLQFLQLQLFFAS